MEKVKVLGVDPSLRNTGLAVVEYNSDPKKDEKAFKVTHAQVLINPLKYKGKDAILSMLDMIHEESKKECYQDVHRILVESPPIMFNQAWAQSTISSIAHISGGAVALLGIEKALLFRPNEWMRTRKKDVVHSQAFIYLGHPDTWHYEKPIKAEKYMEHSNDAASMALWWIRSNYQEE